MGPGLYFCPEVFVALFVVGGGVALVPVRLAKGQWLSELVCLHGGADLLGVGVYTLVRAKAIHKGAE